MSEKLKVGILGGRYDWGIGYVGNWSFYFPAGIDAEEEVVYEV